MFVYKNVLYRKYKNVRNLNNRYNILIICFDYKAIFIYIIFDTIFFQLAGRNKVDKGWKDIYYLQYIFDNVFSKRLKD